MTTSPERGGWRASRRGGADHVWDSVRGRWLLLTPEEWVRRHLLAYLERELGVPGGNIVQEFPVSLEGMPQRADVVVTDRQGRPVLLAECKAPDVAIDAGTLDQAVRYNSVVGARYIVLTNGLRHYCYVTYNGIDYSQLDTFPVIG